MALKSESPSPPNGMVDIVPSKSAPEPDEDLEDGEIFDDDEDEPVPAPKPAEPAAPPKESIATIVQQMQQIQQQMGLVGPGGGMGVKRRGSPMDRGRPRPTRRLRRPKRLRDDDKPFPSKKRRRSDDEKPSEDVGTEEEEEGDLGRESSPMRDWFRSDDEDEELGFNDGPGGRGGMRRGRRDFGRSRRGGRGGRGGGRRGPNSRREGGLCKFFLQGTCQRGNDCPYSHTIYPRKYELCRFYMNDCCVKKDKCNYMHEDFPCKFWHLGLKCYAGKRCKFSHQKVTPYIKQMLLKHNQVESDKHFIQQLQTLGDSRSPTPPDYSDYEAPSGNSNYVIVGRKRGSNVDDITVDDIELLDSDHEDKGDRQGRQEREDRSDRHDKDDRLEREDRDVHMRSEKGGRSHRHRNERSSRHSRDDDHRDQDDHRDRSHKDQDDRRDRSHKDQEDHRDRSHKDHRSDRNERNNKSDKDSTRSHHMRDRERERDANPSYDERRSDEEDGRTPMPSPSQQSSDSRDIETAESRDFRMHSPPPSNKEKSSRNRERDRDKDSRRKDKDRESRQRDHKSKKDRRSRTKSRSRSRSQSRTRTPSPPTPRERESSQSCAKLPPPQEVLPVETSGPSEVPPNLPKKQMELYLRIQQQQREAGNIEEEDDTKDKEDEDKDDWYSSDEEGGDKSGPLATILNKLKSQPKPVPPEPPKVDISNAIPDFDISAVSKLLSSVRETIEQKKNTPQSPKNSEPSKLEEKKPESPVYDDKRRRDPRLMIRGDASSPSSSPPRQPMKLPPLDIDLRVPGSSSAPPTGDVDLRQLPFKPVPMHQAAKEIDASTTSNPPIPWVLIKFPIPPKPDYSHIHPKNPMDPRLKKYQSGSGMPPLPAMNQMGGMTGPGGFVLPQFNPVMQQPPMQPMVGLPGAPQPPAARDPRQRAFATNDPRRKPAPGPPTAMPVGQFPNQLGFPSGRPGLPPMGVPGMPMFPGRQDSDLRNPNPFLQNDIDFRFQQPASHPPYP